MKVNMNKMKNYILKLLLSLSFLLSFNSFAVDTSSQHFEQSHIDNISEGFHQLKIGESFSNYDGPTSLAQDRLESSASHRASLAESQNLDSLNSSTEPIRLYNDGDSFSSLAELVRPSRGAAIDMPKVGNLDLTPTARFPSAT